MPEPTPAPGRPISPARIDVFLQYYRPHVSGLTNMAAEIAEYAAAHGFEVHVHAVGRRREERILDGVHVHIYREVFRLSRAVFSIELLAAIWKLRQVPVGITHAHLPYPESVVLAALTPRSRKLCITYHCDAPKSGGVSTLIAMLLDWSHRRLIKRADVTICSTSDYAMHSRLRDIFSAQDSQAITVTSIDRAGGTPRYRVDGKRLIGFIGRPTHEKGIDVLLDAMASLPEDTVLLFAGPTDGLTESMGFDAEKASKLAAAGRMISLGFLDQSQIDDFYASIDVFVHPSINSFEAFGIVQVEAMSAGVPVVATNIPGARTVVQRTGFGAIAEPGDSVDLVAKISEVLSATYDRGAVRAILEAEYLAPVPHAQYLDVFRALSNTE